jgi:hypothetical protein
MGCALSSLPASPSFASAPRASPSQAKRRPGARNPPAMKAWRSSTATTAPRSARPASRGRTLPRTPSRAAPSSLRASARAPGCTNVFASTVTSTSHLGSGSPRATSRGRPRGLSAKASTSGSARRPSGSSPARGSRCCRIRRGTSATRPRATSTRIISSTSGQASCAISGSLPRRSSAASARSACAA